ncbi:MAG: carboxyl transferase domain-containing protein [Oscillospiraceae bacterium]
MAFSKTLAEMEQNVPDSDARKRLTALFDEDSFRELDKFMAPNGEQSSVVAGYGTVMGATAYAYAQDVSVKGGAVNKSAAVKIRKIYELAAKNGAPVVAVFDSKGGDISEGMAVLSAYGDIIKASAAISGVVPQIAVICGVCAGAAALIASMADVKIMTEKAELFMTAPFNTPDGKLEGAGTAANAAKAGVCDILAKDDAEAVAKAKKLIAMLPANNISLAGNDDFAENDAIVSAGMSGKDIIAAVADKNSVTELGAQFGSAAYTAIASVNWATVAFVATDNAEKLTAADSAKIARFVQLADVFSIPVVTVIDTQGFVPSSEAELSGSVRDCAKLAQVYASATTVKVNLIKGKAFGAAYAAFDSADISYAWENAQIAPMAPEAAKVFMGEEIETSPFGAAALGMVDAVIAADDTKDAIASAVDLCSGKRVAAPTRKHVNFAF